jgi:hypothetical protein
MLLALLLPMMAVGQPTGRLKAGEEPPYPLKGDMHAIADPAPLRSFKDLCDRVAMIVEGVVETDAARQVSGPNAKIETDFWIAVDRVFKGPPEARRLVTSEMGGTFGEARLLMNYPLMRRGERYILFLYKNNSPDRPPVADLMRYTDDVFYGRFLIEDGTVRLNSPYSSSLPYNGTPVEAFRRAILMQLGK